MRPRKLRAYRRVPLIIVRTSRVRRCRGRSVIALAAQHGAVASSPRFRRSTAHTLPMRRVESAGNNDGRAGDGPAIRQVAEHQEAEAGDPKQLAVEERREQGSW